MVILVTASPANHYKHLKGITSTKIPSIPSISSSSLAVTPSNHSYFVTIHTHFGVESTLSTDRLIFLETHESVLELLEAIPGFQGSRNTNLSAGYNEQQITTPKCVYSAWRSPDGWYFKKHMKPSWSSLKPPPGFTGS